MLALLERAGTNGDNCSVEVSHAGKKAFALRRGEVRNLGSIAGTDAHGAIPGIGAADLGEVVQLPDGSLVAVFGDCFGGDKVGTHPRTTRRWPSR